ncbi:hypothetical protein BGW42_007616 [Actinomortierella wolfii]|nr:hypothetical protein BGW42_007616 [Actinomortierella wolfii]
MKPVLLTSLCALLLSVVAASPKDSCKDLANFAQTSNRLPKKPDEDGVVRKINGYNAKKMFPGVAKKISLLRSYTFVTYFNECTPGPAYTQVQIKSGPYKIEETTKTAYDLSLQLGFEADLATLFKYLPSVSAKTSVSRGYEKITVAGVDIKDGEFKQQCVISPGWWCTAYIRLDDIKSGEIIVDDRIRKPVFFPASLNSKPLLSEVWIEVPAH